MGRLKEDIKHDISLKHMETMQFYFHIQEMHRDTNKYIMRSYIGSTDQFVFIRKSYLKLLKNHKTKWRKDGQKDNALVGTINGKNKINVNKENCSPWKIMMKRK